MTIRLSDTFTDANGTLLEAHIMDIGPGWQELSAIGDWSIQSNKAQPNSLLAMDSIVSNGGVANGRLTVSLTFPNLPLLSWSMGLAIRMVDKDNGWYTWVRYNAGGPDTNIEIIERVAGVNTTRATTPISDQAGLTKTILSAWDNSGMFCLLIGVSFVSYSSIISNPTETKHGLVADTSTGAVGQYDTFLFETFAPLITPKSKSVYQQLISR